MILLIPSMSFSRGAHVPNFLVHLSFYSFFVRLSIQMRPMCCDRQVYFLNLSVHISFASQSAPCKRVPYKGGDGGSGRLSDVSNRQQKPRVPLKRLDDEGYLETRTGPSCHHQQSTGNLGDPVTLQSSS